jgi:transcription elongation factor GreA
MIKVPMTIEGAARLKAELHRLKTVERPAVIEALAEARSHGDLSENADYDAAKERQGFIEGRISEVESKLAHAQVINPADIEADIKAGKLSVNSPIARALIGKTEGDTAEVQAPGGLRSYEVLAVRYV